MRFAFWSAEEEGLIGSGSYVSHLSDQEKAKIALNLDYHMLGSRNGIRGFYDATIPSAQVLTRRPPRDDAA
ncbi:MAG: Aminopeptidase [Streptosporangiaceae bacterium]|nr:Aminopeptidase [Streptosporangiaceae bacterium]